MQFPNYKIAWLIVLLVAGGVRAGAQSVYSTPYAFKNFAGDPGVSGSADGNGSAARFTSPRHLTLDGASNIYVADYANCTIRKIDTSGNVTTLAGTAGVTGSADGNGSAAQFNHPTGVAVDSAGNVYVADEFNYTIRKIDTAANVTTLAGTAGVPGGVDAQGSAASFYYPNGVALDSAGNLYVADEFNCTIRKIDTAANVTTLAGAALACGSADGQGSAAQFYYPTGVAVDSAGNVYVADYYNSTIRKIDTAANVTTLAGTAGVNGSADGNGTAAQFSNATGVAVDSAGNIYVADYFNSTIRKIDTANNVTTLAGDAGVTGTADGTGIMARFDLPWSVAVDNAGVLYVADFANDRITKGINAAFLTTLVSAARDYLQATVVSVVFNEPVVAATANNSGNYTLNNGGTIRGASLNPDGVTVVLTTSALYNNVTHILTVNNVTGTNGNTIAANSQITIVMPPGQTSSTTIYEPYSFANFIGDPGTSGFADGQGTAATFNTAHGLALDSAGNLYVADEYNCTIRKSDTAGNVTTLAGTAGVIGSADGNGSAAQFNHPTGVAVDSAGNVYVADYYNWTIRKIDTAANVTTFAGTAGVEGSTDGQGSAASFAYPNSVGLDSAGNLYVADEANQEIRKIDTAANVTTLAGSPLVQGSADGTGSAASFEYPNGIALDSAGNIYTADAVNNTIRKITQAGVVTTLAGTALVTGSADGNGSAAQFNQPYGVATDGAGNVYVADSLNYTVRKIDTAANVVTLGGVPLVAGDADGVGSAAQFNHPYSLEVDRAGNLYVSDYLNYRVTRGNIVPMTVVSAARDYLQQTMVSVVFSQTPVAATAINLSNYALNNGATISAVTLNLDGSVTLTTSPLFNNMTYILTVNNVQGAGGATTIANNTQITVSVPSDAIRAEYNLAATNDLVSLEAEDYNLNTPGGGSSWVFTTAPPLASPTDANTNFSGSGVMVADPVIGRDIATPALGSAVADSPCLDFTVQFTNTGTFYVWVRGLGDGPPGPGASDSVFVGLDNALTSEFTGFPLGQGYCWASASAGSEPMVITTPGFHLISVWMQQDGFTVDKLLLTDNAAFTPSNLGPAESLPVPAVITVAQSGTNLVLSWSVAGTLQSSTNVTGPYLDIPGSSSPFDVSPAGPQNFYRVRQQ